MIHYFHWLGFLFNRPIEFVLHTTIKCPICSRPMRVAIRDIDKYRKAPK